MKYTDDKIQQQIEAYLNQDMSDLDRSRFEKLIHDDEELHDEVEMQEATIEAIRNERILGLKAGLSQVNISLWSVTLMEAAKVATIVASIGIASVGGYYLYSNSKTQKSNPSTSVSEKPIVADSHTENQTAKEDSKEITGSENVSQPVQSFESKPEHATAPVISEKAETVKSVGFNQKKSKTNPVSPNAVNSNFENNSEVTEPNVKTITPSNAKDIALPEDGISNKSVLETVNPEVVIKKDNKDKFHYQFSDSKLILYADFADKIYEILELNQGNQKNMFLAFQNKFYSLDASKMEITPLKEVNDQQLIQVLNAYQKRKN
jgi:hypothetical protein